MLHCIYSGKPPHALKGLRKELIWTGRKNHALHFFNVSQKPDITSGGGHEHYFRTRDLWTLLVAVHETIGEMIKEKREIWALTILIMASTILTRQYTEQNYSQAGKGIPNDKNRWIRTHWLYKGNNSSFSSLSFFFTFSNRKL